MASVFKRPGSRSRPGDRWFVRFRSADGRWISRRVQQETRRDALRVAQALAAKAERQRLGLEVPEEDGQLVGPLMRAWAKSLKNRSRDTDLCRIDRHVLPHWRGVRVADVDLPRIMKWLDRMAATAEIGPASQRHCLGLLSRFLSWAVERGHAQRNVCRDITAGKRPRPIPPPPESIPWLRDDADVLRVLRALPAPFDAVFFIGNRSGARLGEILALRFSDLDDIDEGAIRIRYAGEEGDGWLKECKRAPKTKYAPISAADARLVLGPIIAARKAAGAAPEGFVFVDADGDRIDRHAVAYAWRKMAKAVGLPPGLNFYRGTRHSAASRALASGASVGEISVALGHANVATTERHYLHVQRRHFSSILTAGLGLDGVALAKVIPMAGRSPVTETAAVLATETQEAAANG